MVIIMHVMQKKGSQIFSRNFVADATEFLENYVFKLAKDFFILRTEWTLPLQFPVFKELN